MKVERTKKQFNISPRLIDRSGTGRAANVNIVADLVEMTEKAVRENARIAQDQEEYQRQYNGLVERYDAAKARFDEVTETISAKETQAERLAMFERTLKDHAEPVAAFDSQLWAGLVECVTVDVDGGMTVVFWDGTEINYTF